MSIKAISKRIMMSNPPSWKEEMPQPQIEEKKVEAKNKSEKKEKNMTAAQFDRAEALAKNVNAKDVKVVKKDKGLIERTESSKIILTEDNRQVLND